MRKYDTNYKEFPPKKKKTTTKSVHDPLNIARYLPKSAPLKKKCTH